MKFVAAVIYWASLVANIELSSSIENYDPLVLDEGSLLINTTEATWRHSSTSSPTDLEEILTGALEDREYIEQNGDVWPYQVAIFRHNGSIILGGSLAVTFTGQPAVSIQSLKGDVIIGTRLRLDGHIDVFNERGTIGGYGVKNGPGGGGVLNETTPPGGAGHGSYGGGAFETITFPPFKVSKFGYPYHMGDGYHLIGGSSGGKKEFATGLILTNPKGEGAVEFVAKQKISIEGHISASGQSGFVFDNEFLDRHPDSEPCAGGGSGGLIRMKAREIEIRGNGFLTATGGDGARNDNTSMFCGGGGSGGIIEFMITKRAHGYLLSDHLFLQGGGGTKPGGTGTFEITNFKLRNESQSDEGNDDESCSCGTSPPSTEPASEPPSTCPSVTAACDCNNTVTSCPEVNVTESCDCHTSVPEIGGSTTSHPMMTSPNEVDNSVTDVIESTSQATGEEYTTTNAFTSLTPSNAAKYLEETLVQMEGSSGAEFTKEEAVRVLQEAEALGLSLGKQLAVTRKDGETVSTSAASETIGMSVVIEDAAVFDGSTFPDLKDSVFKADTKWTIPSLSQHVSDFLPKENASGYIIVVNILFLELGEALGGNLDWPTETVNSRVVGTSVYVSANVTANFTNSVRMTAEKLQKHVLGNSSCRFWDFGSTGTVEGAWSAEGCAVETENHTHVTCLCDHLTNFAVLLMPNSVVIGAVDKIALGIISYIGLGLSLFSLLLAFISISVSLKSLKHFQSAVIHLNLITALGLADFMFLIGADDTENEVWCTAVAVILHYFFLSTFMWMLCEGFYIYIRVTSVFTDVKGHLKFYFLVGWGVPAIIVGVTAGVNLDGYGTDAACWLATSDNTLWTFAAPVAIVITVNVFFLVMIMLRFLKVKSIAKKSKYVQLRKATRAAIILLPLLGTTWIFGLVAFGSGSVVLFYIFVILNSLQGVFICIFHCLTNDDVASTLRVKLRRSRTQIDVFLSSTDHRRLPKSKSAKTMELKTSSGGCRDKSGAFDSAGGGSSEQWATLQSQPTLN
ncbi:uncharacterized protein [Asterias amurensis]|uniref:uncharacterized protein n=1 Tax=Asterias amurensis TaxID=7602 RepID=UPI003AB841BC